MDVFIRCILAIQEIMNIKIFFIAENLLTPFGELGEAHKESV